LLVITIIYSLTAEIHVQLYLLIAEINQNYLDLARNPPCLKQYLKISEQKLLDCTVIWQSAKMRKIKLFQYLTLLTVISAQMCCSRKYPYPSHARLCSLNLPSPPEILFWYHTFLYKIRLLKPPSPLEFPLTFLEVG